MLVLTSVAAWAWILLVTVTILIIETRLGGVQELEAATNILILKNQREVCVGNS